ncbi:MAG: SRPBCC domain-containing protein [candidate division Zixibacteria bacterium]|nr:SRPBCC domain-containing protein [candidate division Zixibacteria bacterium]
MQGGWSGTLDRLDAHLNAVNAVPDCLSGFKPVEHELTLTRLIDAPRELVFKAWIDEEQMAKWWGPSGFTNPVCELDPRPGGRIYIDMTGPDGTVYPMGGTFHEVTPPERLVFTSTAMKDEDGQPQLEVHNTITFENQGGKTMLKLHAVVVKSSAAVAKALAGMEQGWTESLVRLAALVVRK